MKTLHLFAGAGGGLLADLILGHVPIGAVEIDPYCCHLLREKAYAGWWPQLRVHEVDIRAFDPSEYAGRVDCVSGGFPCQDISVAGKGEGITGERSGLWSEYVRVLRAIRPRYAFVENSPMLTLRGLNVVLSDLAALGYDAEWQVVSAADVGAPHLRERIWILANANGIGKSQPERRICHQRRWISDCRSEVADPDSAGLEGWQCGRMQKHAGEPATRESGAPSAIPECWQFEPSLGRVAHGVAHRVHRLKALGNGQVPLQAAVAWHLLMNAAARR